MQELSKDAELNPLRYPVSGLQTLAKMYEAWFRGKEHYNIQMEKSLMSTQAAVPEAGIFVDLIVWLAILWDVHFYRDT